MPSRRHPLRAAAGLLSFLLGLLLLIEALFYFWSGLSAPNGGRWMWDGLQNDYQETYDFRQEIAMDLQVLLAMGTGDALDFLWYGGGSPAQWYGGGSPAQQAQRVHQDWEKDQNLLYSVSKNGEVLFTNRRELSDKTTLDTLPKGYNFLLQFDGSKVRIWKDGAELPLYEEPYYDFDNWEQWYVPGYLNFKAAPAQAPIHVTMAVLETPKVFIRDNLSPFRTGQYNRLYELTKVLTARHDQILSHLFLLGAGAVLLAVSRLLRSDKARADRAMANYTGKLWFEVKLLLLLLPVLLLSMQLETRTTDSVTLLPGEESSVDVISSPEAMGSFVESRNPVVYVDSVPVPVSLPELLGQIPEHPGPVMLLTLLWYVFGFNDWRHQKKPWQHGICGMLFAKGLKWPLQRRMSRIAGWMGGGIFLLLLELILFLLFNLRGSLLLWGLLLPGGAALAVLTAGLFRQNQIWKDLGILSDQIRSIRDGDLGHPIDLPPGHDLCQSMEDLNQIRQGIRQAVEEQIRSERMKVELITNVSHDLKTPLTSIISYTELLEQEKLAPPAGEYVTVLGQKAQRLKEMVRDVFEISKAASGQLPVQLERLDLVRLLRQTLADQEEAIQASGLVFKTSIPETPIYIRGDSNRLYRVFQNLISNALRYALKGSRVYLNVEEEEDGGVSALLQNTSATELDPNTDYLGRFVRGDESRTDGGSGLGLSIAASFTQVCGGTLEVRTQADLFTVRVTFPVEP